MAKSLNEWKGIGNIGKQPEIVYTQGGKAVAKLSIACADDYKDAQGNKVEQTNWIPVVAFGKLAEIIGQYCRQGSKVYVCGKFVTRDWVDDTGVKRYKSEIVASDLLMLDGKDSQQSAPQSQPAQNQKAPPPIDDFDSDIPF